MSILGTLLKPLVYVSLPVFALKTLADANPIARYYVRLGLYLSTLGVCSVWGVICSIGMGLTGHRFDVFYVVARSFYFLASRVIGIRLVVEGEEYLETRPSVLVGNHQSMVDILYLGRYASSYTLGPTTLTRVSTSSCILSSFSSPPSNCVLSHGIAIESSLAEPRSWPRRSCNGPPFLANS